MRLLKLIAVLLTYPEQEWLQSLGELRTAVSSETGRSRRAGRRLDRLLTHLEQGRLIDVQETYVETFDRNPIQSLYLFEHTMGESRDRGDAMACLIDEYRRSGLEVTSRELPDFLPLFLEFLSLIPAEEAEERLTRIAEVVQVLRHRLADADSPYAGAFEALLTLTPGATVAAALSAIRKRARKPTATRIGTR